MCIGITRDVMKMVDEGKILKEMRAQIEKTYSKYGPPPPIREPKKLRQNVFPG